MLQRSNNQTLVCYSTGKPVTNQQPQGYELRADEDRERKTQKSELRARLHILAPADLVSRFPSLVNFEFCCCVELWNYQYHFEFGVGFGFGLE